MVLELPVVLVRPELLELPVVLVRLVRPELPVACWPRPALLWVWVPWAMA